MVGFGLCYRCGRVGHLARAYSVRDMRNPRELLRGLILREPTTQTRVQTRAYAMTNKEAGTSGIVVTGTLSILVHFALTLFDFSSTYSFVLCHLLVKQGS